MHNALKAPGQMLALARSKAPADRERLLLALAELCDAGETAPPIDVQALLTEIILRLAGQTDPAFRRTLAERLAVAAWVSPPVLQAFAPARAEPPPGRRELERRLVAKLQTAEQLRPGYMLRMLREGRLGLFEAAFFALAGAEQNETTVAALYESPARLALACAAVGIDRSVFPTVLALVRGLRGGAPAGPDSPASLAPCFALPPEKALAALLAGARPN